MTGALTLIGNVNVDLILGPVAPWPTPGTELIVADQDLRFGGSSGNSALAAIALGGEVRVIANIGRDAMGQWLVDHMPEQAKRWRRSDEPTAISVGIGHPEGERTFITALGHLADFSLADVMQQLPSRAVDGEIALLSGVFVTPRLAADYTSLLQALRQRGFVIALDTGWPNGGWSAQTREQLLGWCRLVDFALFNEVEVMNLASGMDLMEAARHVRQSLHSGGALVVKRGGDGASLVSATHEVAISAPAVPVIDTIGAGDVFNAAFLLAAQTGKEPVQALQAAVACASRAVSTRPRQFTRSQAA